MLYPNGDLLASVSLYPRARHLTGCHILIISTMSAASTADRSYGAVSPSLEIIFNRYYAPTFSRREIYALVLCLLDQIRKGYQPLRILALHQHLWNSKDHAWYLKDIIFIKMSQR